MTKSINFAFGNMKIPKTTAIFNMGTAKECPSLKLGLCKLGKKCYALKPEKRFPKTVPAARKLQEKQWKSTDAVTFVADLLAQNGRKRTNKIDSLRFNEAGDFWSQECVDKANQVAELLKPHGIKTYVYTARRDLDYSNITDLVVNASGWELANGNTFTAVKAYSGNGIQCDCDCKKCNTCATNHGKLIEVLMH